ncbi:sec1 family transport protein [Angomonas deanei]|nr:sec1 family transport protein [Angomonas deanei]|eukprot:EPY38456.1 sec1 family transport protein [Angomonas deanei]
MNSIVEGVCHVLMSLDMLPIIAHSKTGAAEEVARRLSVRLSDAVKEGSLSDSTSSSYGRPLILLVDRTSDIATALHHPFTYRGLLVEVGGMRLNKCTVRGADGNDEVVEIDPDRDNFYLENAAREFGVIGENIQEALAAYKAEYQALAEQSAGGGDDSYSDANAMSRLLATAPLLAEEKRSLDTHAKLAYSFLRVIQDRLLDHFHGVESGILRGNMDRAEVTRLLGSSNCSLEDRQRLFLIAYLMAAPGSEEAAFVEKQAPLLERNVSLAPELDTKRAPTSFPAFQYLKHLRSWTVNKTGDQSAANEGAGWGFAQQFVKNIASSLARGAEVDLPLTKLVSALSQDAADVTSYQSSQEATLRQKLLDTVAAVDPRNRKTVNLHHVRFSQTLVFTIGGGSIAEYDDLKRWESTRGGSKSVYYGCTSIVSGEELLKQLSILGSDLQK